MKAPVIYQKTNSTTSRSDSEISTSKPISAFFQTKSKIISPIPINRKNRPDAHRYLSRENSGF